MPPPLVVVLHGAGGTAAWADGETGWSAVAAREGFALALPSIGATWRSTAGTIGVRLVAGATATGGRTVCMRRPGAMVILFLNTPEMEAMAMTSPLTSIASDGGLRQGKGHPRTAGTSARTLGYYVRETKQIGLMDALRKLALMPAQRMERVAPMFKNKGRIRIGADADITVFDPATVIDKSTYQQPALPSVGFRYVLVGGVPVVRDGALQDGAFPGRPARGPVH